jgi:hypothetical protein
MFLSPYVTLDTFVVVDTNCGSFSFPAELVGENLLARVQDEDAILTNEEQKELLQYTAGYTFFSAEVKTGYFSRLSASGYLDCTDWNGPYDTLYECVWDLFNNYFDEEFCSDWLDFLNECTSELTAEEFKEIESAFIGEEL